VCIKSVTKLAEDCSNQGIDNINNNEILHIVARLLFHCRLPGFHWRPNLELLLEFKLGMYLYIPPTQSIDQLNKSKLSK